MVRSQGSVELPEFSAFLRVVRHVGADFADFFMSSLHMPHNLEPMDYEAQAEKV